MKRNIDIHREIKKYLPLLLFPIFFSIALYILLQNFAIRQFEREEEKTIELFYNQMSAMVRDVDNISLSISSDFSMLSNQGTSNALPFSPENPFDICRQIDIRKSNSPYIDHIYYVSEKDDSIYSDSGYYTYSSLSNILSGVGLSTTDFSKIDKATWGMSTLGNLKEPYYVIPFRDADGQIIGHLLSTISLVTFEDTISSLEAEFACLYAEDFIIPSKPLTTDYSTSDLSSQKSVNQLLGIHVKCFYMERDNYTYLIAISAKEYYKPLVWMIISFVIYSLFIFILDYIYLFNVSQKRYKEMTSLISALPQESNVSSSSYQELVPAVQEALLNAADLREKQEQNAKERIIHSILHHNNTPSILEKYSREIDIPDSGVTYCLAIFTIRDWNNIALETSSPEESYQLAWTIFKTVASQFEGESVHIVCDYDTDTFNALFFGDLDYQIACVETICERICRFMHSEYVISLHASVSSHTQKLSEVPRLLTQAQKLESFSQSINDSSSIISEDLLKSSSASYISGDFFRQEMTLANMLISHKYDLVPTMVASILQEHVTNNNDYDVAMCRLKAISETLAEAILTLKNVDLDLNHFAQRLRNSKSINDLNKEVESIFAELDSSIKASPTVYLEVEKACAYIKDNLSDTNLNVTMISEHVGTIPQRLIPMFQKQLNMGIAEYVNYQRIEKATTLLTTTNLKVHQICDAVGYCNTDTFTRNFRKLRDTTPSEYRRLMQ